MTSPKPSRKTKADFAPNNETFRLLFANHPIPMWIYDLKTLAFLDVNDAAVEKYGYTRDEFLKLTLKDIRPVEDAVRLTHVLEQKRPSLHHSGEWRHRLKNGQVIDVEITSHTLDFEGHKAALVMAQDITERKRAEEAQAQQNDALLKLNSFSIELTMLSSEDNLEALIARRIKEIAGAEMAIFSEYNPANKTTTPKHIELKPALLHKVIDLLGKQAKNVHSVVSDEMYREMTTDVIGMRKTLYEASFGAIPRSIGAAIQAMLKVDRFIGIAYLIEGKLYGTSLLGMSRDQPDPPREILKNYIYLAALSLRRKQAEDALRVAKQQWQTTFDAIGDLVCLINSEGQIVRHNRALETFLGKPSSEVDGHLCYELMHGTSEPIENCPFQRAKQSRHRENMVFELNGRWLNVTTDPISNNEEQFVGAAHIVSDITERKHVEMELIQSEAKFRSTFDQSPVGSVIIGLDKRFIRCNSAFCNFLGYPESELIGKTISDITHPEDLEIGMKELKQLVEGEIESFTAQKRYLRKDGAVLWGEISIRLVRDANNKPLYFLPIIQNITERKQAEEALKESEKRFATIFRANPAAIAMTRLDDGHLVDVNAAWQRMTGYMNTEVVGCTAQELGLWIKPEQRERLIEMLGEQSRAHGEMELRHKSGEVRDLLMSADLIELDGKRYLLTMAQDVTEQKRKDEEIRNAHNRIDSMLKFTTSIISAIPTPFFYKDSEGRFLGVNDAFADLMGHTPDFYVGKTVMELWPDDLAKVYREKDLELMSNPERQVYEFKVMDKDGMIHPVIWGKNVFRDENGQVAGIVGAFVDITERKQAEEALRESEKKYRQIVDTAGEGIWMIDAEGNTTFANQKMAEMLGYAAGEMLGVSLFTFMDEDGKALAAANLERRRQGLKEQHDFKFRRKDGTDLWAILETNPILDKDGRYVGALAMITDITERKQAEENLIVSEARYRRLFEAARDGILILDAETGVILDANPFLSEMLGFSHEEICGKELWELGFFKDVAENKANFLELQEKGYIRYDDLPLETANGRKFHVEFISNVYNVNHHKIIQCNIRDITERKQAEDALRTSEARYRLIADHVSDIVWQLDSGLKFIYLSPSIARILGYTADEALGVHVTNFLNQEGMKLMKEIIQSRLDNPDKENEPVEYKMKHKDGHWVDVEVASSPLFDSDGHTIGFAGITRDITERKQVEAKLKESEERFRQIAETIHEVFYTYDPLANKFLYVSPAYETLWQEPIQKVYDDPLSFTNAVHAEDRERFFVAVRREREDGEYFNMQYRIVRPDGSVRHVHSRNYPIFDASGAEYRVVGIAEDITIRKRAEEEILKLNVELEQRVEARTRELLETQEKLVRQEKLAVLGQLAGSVGHELRNPLAVINSALYYLKLIGADSSEKVKEYLGIIQTEAHTCEKIITDLLDFARIKSVDVEPVSVSELTERVLERYPVPKTVNLALDIPENLPKLYVDLRQMEQVLGNLVLNACQAMSSGGELTVTARQEQEMVAIAVQDTGVGIPPENMKKLFEPLFTTKAKGVGLGLAVSRKLTEANGGRIEVQSEAGKGSTFTLVLPAHGGKS